MHLRARVVHGRERDLCLAVVLDELGGSTNDGTKETIRLNNLSRLCRHLDPRRLCFLECRCCRQLLGRCSTD